MLTAAQYLRFNYPYTLSPLCVCQSPSISDEEVNTNAGCRVCAAEGVKSTKYNNNEYENLDWFKFLFSECADKKDGFVY